MINIRTRLTYQFVILVTAILLFFSVGVYFFSKLYLEKRFFKRLQDRALTTTALLFDLKATNSAVLKLVDLSNNDPLSNEKISIYNDTSKKIIFSTNPANSRFHEQFIPQLTAGKETTYIHFGEYQILAIHLPNKGESNWVIVSGIDQTGKDALDDLKKILIVMVGAGILLLGISGWFFAGRALAPMSTIIHQVNAISPVNVEKRVEHPNRSDEIGLLVATFNQLLDRIEQALTTQKIFIANISHELKNPLTKIYSQIDVALIQKRSPEAYQKSLHSLQEDTHTLIQLTNTLLDLANTAANSSHLKLEPVRMDELLWETKMQLQKWHEDYRIEINFSDFPEDEEALLIQGNPASLKVLFMNLLDNACKFSPRKTAIIDFSASKSKIRTSIFNEGPQIPKADLALIFQPFYRSNATAQASKGHGVGLAIVSQITQIHRGEIGVNSTTKGTTFTLIFPSAATF
ncbi:sensor histidine kinase [Tellurirhabdus bombi]|uniref:sensor histidine kinase n=1 Tax=Tellurirhabdus bombi TaxID=2907205 RepID=UPI001F34E8D6|nr:HAMP domain-containing sensor histidine kinase [Tellurirhabdus bombi]